MVIKNTFYLFLIRVNQFVDKITFLVSFREKYTKNKPESSQKWCKNERFRFEKCLMWWCYNRIWTRWYSDSSKTDLIKKKFWNFQKTIVFKPKIISKPAFLAGIRTFSLIFGHFRRVFISFREQKSNFLPLLTRKMTQRKWSWLTIRISWLVYGF